MKEFRKRFILLNVGLAGIVLLAAFGVIGCILCGNVRSDVQNTMSMVLKPWNSDNAGTRTRTADTPEGTAPPEAKDKSGRKPENDRAGDKKEEPQPKAEKNEPHNRREHDDNITTVFYNRETKTVSVVSETPVFDEEPEKIAEAVLQQTEEFGTLGTYGLLFFRETTGNNVKIAVCSESYMVSRLARIVVILSLVYLLSMSILLLISFRLSSFAERPLKRAMEMERKFVADISHDLKTPITIIMANNSIICSHPNASVAEQMKWIESTGKASKDMMDIVSNMLLMSSVDAQPQKIQTVPVNLSAAAQRCILQFESMAYEKEVTMEEEIEEDLTVNATDEYLKTICNCLIENAIKYEPEGGKILIRAFRRKRDVVLRVQNSSSRIEPEDLPHIFDRFYRGDKSRTLSKGHGLGLPIIKQMLTLCGGDIHAESSEDTGTVFTAVFRKA